MKEYDLSGHGNFFWKTHAHTYRHTSLSVVLSKNINKTVTSIFLKTDVCYCFRQWDMNILKISYCFVMPVTTIFYSRCAKLLLHWLKNQRFLLHWGMRIQNLHYWETIFTVCCSENLILDFCGMTNFSSCLFQYPIATDLCQCEWSFVCLHVCANQACVKESNNPLAHTLHMEGFLFLYSLLSHCFTSSLFKTGATVASMHLGCNMTKIVHNRCSYSYKTIQSWQRGSSQAHESGLWIENSIRLSKMKSSGTKNKIPRTYTQYSKFKAHLYLPSSG